MLLLPRLFGSTRILLTPAIVVSLMALGFIGWNIYSAQVKSVQAMNVVAKLRQLRGSIMLFDEVLTMSARMSATTGEPVWEQRYRHNEYLLDQASKGAMQLSSTPETQHALQIVDSANVILVSMENRAFALVKASELLSARELMFSQRYEEQKAIYAAGMDALA